MNHDQERIQKVATMLRKAERPVRILRSIAWPVEVRERFFSEGAKSLPKYTYPPFDPTKVHESIAEIRRHITGDNAIDHWLRRQADAIACGADLLAHIGTPDFFTHSQRLYGAPQDTLLDQNRSALDLAHQFNDILDQLHQIDVGGEKEGRHTADDVAKAMRKAVKTRFGKKAPRVYVVDELSANALAGPTRIRIRRGAMFSDKDIVQLIHHEAFIHVATSLNGRTQTALPILASSHPGTTRTQEGLAVFAEFITGSIDLDRMRRLTNRILAIQMVLDGANFIEVYHFFLDHSPTREQAFENTRRVFRGGVITGGTPFTKDIVYLGGLLRTHNFLRSAVAAGRADCLRLLFCGKLDIEDLPALCELTQMGLCKPPVFLPPWADDLRFLLTYLAYSSFLNTIDLRQITAYYETLLASAPIVAV